MQRLEVGATTSRIEDREEVPLRTVAVAVALLVAGIVFIGASVPIILKHKVTYAIPFLILGALTLIPGIYSCTILLLAYCGWPGYTFRLLPSYD